MIAIYPISPQANNGKNVFLPNMAPTIGYAVDQAYAYYKHETPIAAFTNDSVASKSFADVLEGQLKQCCGGTGYATNVLVPSVVGDFTPLAASLNRAAPKAVMVFAGSSNGFNMMKSIAATGTNVQHFYFVWANPTKFVYDSAGTAAAEKLIVAQAYPPFDDPRMKAFVKDMAAEKARGDINANLDAFEGRSVDAWVGVRALYAATRGMKDITAANITAKLNTAKDLNVGPFLPPWTPSEPGPAGLSRLSNTTVYLATYKNGKQVLVLQSPVKLSDAQAGKFPAK
jgi:ABC-type branched-subunit amino acid transport system substrate-binding protein